MAVDIRRRRTIDIDSTVVETYGLAKQGGQRFSYLGARGYHPELLHARLRGANAASGRARRPS